MFRIKHCDFRRFCLIFDTMLHTFHIDGSDNKAKALMEFLRTLEFVKEAQIDWGDEISLELESSIFQGLKDEKEGKTIAHESVMEGLRKEFPHLGI